MLTVWSDINNLLELDAHGDIEIVKDIDAVMTSVANILGTARGQRVMRCNFASSLRGLIGEPMQYEALQLHFSEEIRNTIMRWDNRVEVKNVGFTILPERNALDLTVYFRIIHHPDKIFQITKIVK